LIRGDEVDSGLDRSLPPELDGGAGAEIVIIIPAPAVGWGETIQRVESDPEAELVGVIHQRAESSGARGRPVSGARLATLLDRVPGVVPPAAVVRRPLCQEPFWRQSGAHLVALCF